MTARIQLRYPALESLRSTTVQLRAPTNQVERHELGGPGRRQRRREMPPTPVTRRLRFGGPLAAPIGEDYVKDDADLVAFMRTRQAGWHLVHSAVTFDVEDGDPELETAEVKLTLSAQPGAEASAWSMLPIKAATPLETKHGFSFAPELKLAGGGGGLGGFENARVEQREDVYLRADGELTAEPAWKFKRTKAVRLVGTHRLMMVVRGSPGTTARLAVTLKGSARTGRLPGRFRKTIKLSPSSLAGIELRF